MLYIAIFISVYIPIALLHSRKKKWNTVGFKIFFGITMLIIGLIGILSSNTHLQHFFFFSFLSTPFYLSLDFFFKNLSIKIQGRDFYLYTLHSNERTLFKNGRVSKRHIRTSDKLISLFLLLSTIALVLIYIVIGGPVK